MCKISESDGDQSHILSIDTEESDTVNRLQFHTRISLWEWEGKLCMERKVYNMEVEEDEDRLSEIDLYSIELVNSNNFSSLL